MAYTIKRITKSGAERWTGYYRVPLDSATITREETADGTTDETITLKPVYKSAGTFDTEAEALKVAEEEEERLSSSYGTSPSFRATATVLDYFPFFLTWHRKEPNTMEGYEYLLKRFFLPAFGKDRVRTIEHAALQNFLDILDDEHNVTPSTLKHLRAALAAFFTVARRRGFRDDNPAEGLTTTFVVQKDQEAWDASIFNVFVTHLPNDPARTFAKTQVATGLRIGEMCALRRNAIHINPDGSGILTVATVVIELDRRRAESKNKAHLIERDRTKTKRVRRIPLSRAVVKMLLAYFERYDIAEDDLVFPARLVSPGAVYFRKRLSYEEMLADCEKRPTPTSKTNIVYEHGTVGAYVTGKCRGALCRHTFTVYSNKKKAERQGREHDGRRVKREPGSPEHLSPATWSRMFKKAAERAEVPHVIPAKNLRHTFVVQCLRKGMDGNTVARLAGHTKEVMLNNYVVWSLDSFQDQVAAMEDFGIDFAA